MRDAARARSTRCPKVELPPGKTDTDFVLGLLRARKASSPSTDPDSAPPLEDGFFRIVFLASLDELERNLRRCRRLHRRVPIRVATIRYACVAAAVTIVLLWTLYSCARPLLLIYVSALFATGLAPLVHIIERQRMRRDQQAPPAARRGDPRDLRDGARHRSSALPRRSCRRWSGQSQEFWTHLPAYMDSAQQKLASWGLIAPDGHRSRSCCSRRPPEAVTWSTSILATLWGFVGGIFGVVSILLLTFYLLVESATPVRAVRAALSAPRSPSASRGSASWPPRRSARGSAARCCSA